MSGRTSIEVNVSAFFDKKTIGWIQDTEHTECGTIQQIIFGYSEKVTVHVEFDDIESWQKAIDYFGIKKIMDHRGNDDESET
jgi:hypothetical protein